MSHNTFAISWSKPPSTYVSKEVGGLPSISGMSNRFSTILISETPITLLFILSIIASTVALPIISLRPMRSL